MIVSHVFPPVENDVFEASDGACSSSPFCVKLIYGLITPEAQIGSYKRVSCGIALDDSFGEPEL